MSTLTQHRAWPYLVSVASFLVALILTLLLRGLFVHVSLLLFWAAVSFSGWYGGLWPALLTTVLSTAAGGILLNSSTPAEEVAILLVFAAIAYLVSSLHEREKRASTALTTSGDQLNTILRGVSDGVYAQDVSGNLIFANAAARALLGLQDADTATAPLDQILRTYDLLDEQGKPLQPSEFPTRSVLRGEPGESRLMRFHHRENHKDRWLNVRASTVQDGGQETKLVITLFQDITDFKEAQAALEDERERYRVTLSGIGDGVIATDTQGHVTFLNPIAEALTGWTMAEAANQHIHSVFNIVNETTRAVVENPIKRVLDEGIVVGLANHTILIDRQGGERPIDDSGAPIRDADGTIIGAVLVFRDVADRRHTEAVLRESEQRFQMIANDSPALIWMSDTTGGLVYLNKAWLDFTGRPLETQLGEGWAAAVHPDDVEARVIGYHRAFDARQPFSLEYRLRNADHEYRWMLVRGIPRYAPDGAFLGFLGLCLDVTERRRVEETQRFLAEVSNTLAASLDYEETLAAVTKLATPTIADWCAIDMLTDGEELERLSVSHVDPNKVKWAYEIQEKYPTELDPSTGIGKVLATGQPDVTLDVTEEMIAAANLDPEQLALVRAIGFRSVMTVPLRGRDRILGAITLVMTTESGRYFEPIDVAMAEEMGRRAGLAVDNARLYREAQQQRERLNVTLSSIGDAVIATDADGNITFINAVTAQISGWSEVEAIGQPLERVFYIINEQTREVVESPYTKVMREGQVVGLANHTLLVRRDGIEVPIDDSGAPIRDHEGQITGVVLVFRDVTERKQMEAARASLLEQERHAREEAERANDLKLKFLAMISHELRTPLTSIKGFSSTLLAPDIAWDAEHTRQFIGIMDSEADKLTELVEQLLDVSRLQAGTLRINLEPHRVVEIVDAAMPQLQALSADHMLEVDVPNNLPIVLADDRRIAQVITNLVDNAVKYSPAGAPVTLDAKLDGGYIGISVGDQGEGIPPQDREAAFEAFRQIERDNKPHKGAGLGLSICKGIIEAHGGRIWIEDNQPTGTVFHFTLPLAPETQGNTQ
jgi:PAS domain S-box-containing protein